MIAKMAKSFIDEDVAAQRARNEKLLEVFGQHGADLNQPREIDFFFYTDDQSAARGLARDLEKAGFDAVHVADHPHDGRWSVQAVRTDSVAAVTGASFVEQIVRLAAQHLAEFDGWGAPI